MTWRFSRFDTGFLVPLWVPVDGWTTDEIRHAALRLGTFALDQIGI